MYIHENEVRFGIKIDMDTYVRGFVLMIDKMSSIWKFSGLHSEKKSRYCIELLKKIW